MRLLNTLVIASLIALAGCSITPVQTVVINKVESETAQVVAPVVKPVIPQEQIPTPFKLGDEARPPVGCIEARTRGIDC